VCTVRFSLLYSPTLKVASNALELLFVCCSARPTVEAPSYNTYAAELAAATAAAHARDERPFEKVVAHLASGEIALKVNALTLLNCLLSISGSVSLVPRQVGSRARGAAQK
jgi:hypothetical protein